MGRLPIYGEPEPEDDVDIDTGESPERPRDSHDEGCPGAWSRCGFVTSLQKYERFIRDNDTIPNLLLDRCDDPLVLEAIQFIEGERLRWRWHRDGERNAQESAKKVSE